MPANTDAIIDAVYRSDWGRIIATLIRQLGDFELAEDAAQEAFAAAVNQWRESGVPDSPVAWIIQAAKHKAIDRIRRRAQFDEKVKQYASSAVTVMDKPQLDSEEIPDDRLRLIFTCCHPAIAVDAQVALTLRTLGGLETDEIARAFLVPTPTMAQRLVRAKHKIRDANIPYAVPDTNDMPERLDAVLTVIYLIFNEGYSATRGESLVRTDLCAEAIRLGRVVRTLIPHELSGETCALVALMLLHDSRRAARLDENGDLITLEEQNRTLWNREHINEALDLVAEAFQQDVGPYALQAAIAAQHCRAERPEQTDWDQILRLYNVLERVQPTPVVSLNRAVAVAMVEGPPSGIALMDKLAASGELDHYHLLHAARADLLRRNGSAVEAAKSYTRALELATNDSERRYLERRLREVSP